MVQPFSISRSHPVLLEQRWCKNGPDAQGAHLTVQELREWRMAWELVVVVCSCFVFACFCMCVCARFVYLCVSSVCVCVAWFEFRAKGMAMILPGWLRVSGA